MDIQEVVLPTTTTEEVFIEAEEVIILDLTLINLKIELLITKGLMMGDIKNHMEKVVIKSIHHNTIRIKRLMSQ
jgi:hypothetical protein